MAKWDEIINIDPRLKAYVAKSEDDKQKKCIEDRSIYGHTMKLLAALQRLVTLGYVTDEHIIELTAMACKYHDVGKVNEHFQKRVQSEKFIRFNKEIEIPHNVLSIFSIPKDVNDYDFYILAYAVLHHHQIEFLEFLAQHNDLMKSEVQANADFLTKRLTRQIKAIEKDGNLKTLYGKDVSKFLDLRTIVTGLLIKCDYAASGDYQIEYKADFLEKALDNQLVRWENEQHHPVKWNALQDFCVAHQDENLLLIGETGLGKTEGALLWIGDNKGFFFLPIRTAINAIYQRATEELLKDEPVQERVALLHSSAVSYYLDKMNKEEVDAFAYNTRGKQLSLPLTISTVDQLFDFVFKNHGYQLKLATLSYSKIVIDEIQMYDAQLLAYLVYGLQLISELGGKIAIITATLPPFIADLLEEKINFKRGTFTKKEAPRHNIKVLHERININHIMERYTANERAGKSNKILVICNTVNEAQQVYITMSKNYPELFHQPDEKGKTYPLSEIVHVFHGRFTKQERTIKERDILAFGKTYEEDRRTIHRSSGIWITTSICEASLDIDFDVLFTEMQYLTSLLQRFGRCNRKGVKDTSAYNCYVYTEIDENLLTSGSRGFIDSKLYELSVEALKDVDGLVTEEDKLEWIEHAFTTAEVEGSKYFSTYQEHFNIVSNREAMQESPEFDRTSLRDISSFDVIPAAFLEGNYYVSLNGKEVQVRSIYDEVKRLLHNPTSTAREKSLAKEQLEGFTVSINGRAYWKDVYRNQRAQNPHYAPLSITSFWQIPVVNYYYDSTIGLQFIEDSRIFDSMM